MARTFWHNVSYALNFFPCAASPEPERHLDRPSGQCALSASRESTGTHTMFAQHSNAVSNTAPRWRRRHLADARRHNRNTR